MNVLSLFSGCGGMDIGFEGGFTCLKNSINSTIHPEWIKAEGKNFVTVADTNFTTIFANDIRNYAKAAWVSYFEGRIPNADEIYHVDSIVNLVERAKAGEQIFPNDVDVVTGGFPCQSFSISGKRLGFNDQRDHLGKIIDEPTPENRGMLYMWMREVITLTAPKLFVAENVKGLTNLGNAKEVIEHDFANAGSGGYLVVPAKVLHAPEYGVPQSRERVFFFGFRKDALKTNVAKALSSSVIPEKYDPYPPKTHGQGLASFVTCADAFINLPEPEFAPDLSQQKYSRAKYMGKHCQGQKEVNLNSLAPTIRAEHHGNIEYRRLSVEHGGLHVDELSAGHKERRLTIRECARIQTFPDQYQFILQKTKHNVSVSASNAYKLIGNAVPPLLAYNIAKNLEVKWDLWF